MPIRATNVDSLTNFQKNAKAILAELEATGEPLVLTVNGRAEVVVQDAAAYQRLVEDAENYRLVQGVKKAIREAEQGLVRPVEEVFEELHARYPVLG